MSFAQLELILWIAFGLFIVAMLLLDLGVLNRKSHALSLKEAGLWSGAWIALAFIFNVVVYYTLGLEKAGEFLAGYLIEESLSVDNIFVFIIIFGYFRVSAEQQPRVLKWGILGAILMRGVLIFAGAALIKQFHWMTYIFGGILMLTVVKMMFLADDSFNPENNPLLRLARRFMPVTTQYHGDKFFIRDHARRLVATPLFLVVLVVESSDLIFALDSIPAIFAISENPFIIYTSNIFAIMGLRALYFLLAGIADYFHYLKPGIILILLFVAVKMLIVDLYKIPTSLSLLIIGGILATSIVASLVLRRKAPQPEKDSLPTQTASPAPFHKNGHPRGLPQEAETRKHAASS